MTIAPAINFNTVKASQEDDLIEVTTQTCGIQGYGDTTVTLTRQQYRDLEAYLVEFRARLNQTSTREEAIPIFKEAVVELDRYGLLPKGMSIEQAQQLVIGSEPSEQIQECFKKFLDRNQRGSLNNTLCLVAGKVDRFNIWSWMMQIFSYPIGFFILLYIFLQIIGTIFPCYSLLVLAGFFMVPFFYCAFVKPINILSYVDFRPSANGSIHSLGLSGSYSISGEFEGEIIGFTGIRILRLVNINPPPVHLSPGAFFLGSALSISLQNKN